MKEKTIKPESCDKCLFLEQTITTKGIPYINCKYYNKGTPGTNMAKKFPFCKVESIVVKEKEYK